MGSAPTYKLPESASSFPHSKSHLMRNTIQCKDNGREGWRDLMSLCLFRNQLSVNLFRLVIRGPMKSDTKWLGKWGLSVFSPALAGSTFPLCAPQPRSQDDRILGRMRQRQIHFKVLRYD
jgi:hypothetical protein